MNGSIYKNISGSKYKYVSCVKALTGRHKGQIMWRGSFCNYKTGKWGSKCFMDERDAALYVDKRLLKNNKEPVNILIRK